MATHAAMTAPSPIGESGRIDHIRLRRRMLYGEHEEDVKERINSQAGPEKSAAWGKPDMTSNALCSAATARATLFDRQFKPQHQAEPQRAMMLELVKAAGLSPMLQRFQRDTIGLREMVMRVDVVEFAPRRFKTVYRPIFPDMVAGTPDVQDPTRAVVLRECRLFTHPVSKQAKYLWETWDISDPARPSVRVLATDEPSSQDMSEWGGLPPGGLVGDQYPKDCRYADGRPLIPYAIAHAAITGSLWDSYSEMELAEGTLQLGVLWTYYHHIIRNAAWAQRWMAGYRVSGATVRDDGTPAARKRAVADPAVVLGLEEMEDAKNPQVGQWGITVDPLKVAEGNMVFERRLANIAGIGSQGDQQRMSGDPRSGYAIAISMVDRVLQQMRFGPVFSLFLAELLTITAVRMNGKIGAQLFAEDGWDAEYAQPLSMVDPMQRGEGADTDFRPANPPQ